MMELILPDTLIGRPPEGGVVKPPGRKRDFAAGWGTVPQTNTTGFNEA